MESHIDPDTPLLKLAKAFARVFGVPSIGLKKFGFRVLQSSANAVIEDDAIEDAVKEDAIEEDAIEDTLKEDAMAIEDTLKEDAIEDADALAAVLEDDIFGALGDVSDLGFSNLPVLGGVASDDDEVPCSDIMHVGDIDGDPCSDDDIAEAHVVNLMFRL